MPARRAKDLKVWLLSAYCQRKEITEDAVAEVVRRRLAEWPLPSRQAVPGGGDLWSGEERRAWGRRAYARAS
jgi:hypothetical protein